MTGVHGLEHVPDFGTTDFTYQNPIGTHSQGIAHQVALRNLSRIFVVVVPSL